MSGGAGSFRLRSACKKHLTQKKPKLEEQGAISADLRSYSDAGAALIGASYVDDALQNLLLTKFVPLGTEEFTRLFDGSAGGIVGTFSAKVRIGYAMGLYGPITHAELLLLNDIRNAFAHSLHKLDFSVAQVKEDCAKFTLIKQFWKHQIGIDFPITEAKATFCEVASFFHVQLLTLSIQIGAEQAAKTMELIASHTLLGSPNPAWGVLI